VLNVAEPPNTFQAQIDTLTTEQGRQEIEQDRQHVEQVDQAARTNSLRLGLRWYWVALTLGLGFLGGVAATEWASYNGWWLSCYWGFPC
jgi:hypothetical protein